MHDYPEHRFRHTGATRQLIQAAGLIESLPLGYDTRVGERGYRLSGGQRQLLSLARAILRDPELLILDEATSALDSQRERLVQEAIERFERNHTVLVSTYWLSATLRADKILVLEADRIVEQRNHVRAPRIISINRKSCGHKNAAKEAATQENIISTIDEFP
jgi:ABC-type multidrug transport system fused ATPase/permease subunit